MARITSVGGIATLLHVPEADADIINVNVRLYAKTDMGLLAIDRRPQSYSSGVQRDALRKREANALRTLHQAPDFLRPELGEGRTQGPWQGVMEELKEFFELETDPETLQALPFELVVDRELAEILPGE